LILAVVGALAYFLIGPIEASVPAGFIKANCNPDEGEKNNPIRDTGYQIQESRNSEESGLYRKIYISDGIGRKREVEVSIRNNSLTSKVNTFRSGDKVGVVLKVTHISGAGAGYEMKTLRFKNNETGSYFAPGSFTTSQPTEDFEFTIPANFTGKMSLRFTNEKTLMNCGPGFFVWSDLQVASATATVTPTTTSSVTTTPTPDDQAVLVTLKPGFNAYSTTWAQKILTRDVLSIPSEEGVTVWAYNRHGDGDWYTTGSSVENIYHRIGYYIYNPDTTDKVIKLIASENQEEPETTAYLAYGWNLMANSATSAAVPLSNLYYYLNPCPPNTAGIATCKTIGERTALSDLFVGTEQTQKAYPYIFIIKDLYATDPSEAFETIQITAENRTTVTIPAGKQFWVYVWPE